VKGSVGQKEENIGLIYTTPLSSETELDRRLGEKYNTAIYRGNLDYHKRQAFIIKRYHKRQARGRLSSTAIDTCRCEPL
jgi:hypothetical protein